MLCTNVAVDFFNEVSLIWGIICDVDGEPSMSIGEGFPPGFEYRWASDANREAMRCSGPDYIGTVITWIEGELSNEAVFPTTEGKR